jgi:hypothetical protein
LGIRTKRPEKKKGEECGYTFSEGMIAKEEILSIGITASDGSAGGAFWVA